MTLVDGPQPGATEVTVWTLEMTDRASLRPAGPARVEAQFLDAGRPAPELSRFFYQLVGDGWYWVDRLDWSDERWRRWVDRPEHQLASCWVDGVPAGYYELEQQGRSVEIAYLGLAPDFIGLGLGGAIVTRALRHAWSVEGTERVWLHTCSLDGPTALSNYRARGLELVDTSTEWRLVEPPPDPG